MKPFKSPEVSRVFNDYPTNIQRKMLELRELVFQTAAITPAVGEIEETLKWGEPAYVTTKSKSGSTLRIDWKEKHPEQYGMYFHCQTNLVSTFRTLFRNELNFEGNRAIILSVGEPLPKDALKLCIEAAFTYHLRKAKSVSDTRRIGG